jgi:hypothetical protein
VDFFLVAHDRNQWKAKGQHFFISNHDLKASLSLASKINIAAATETFMLSISLHRDNMMFCGCVTPFLSQTSCFRPND